MQFDSAAITQENYRIFVDFLKIKLGHDLGEGKEYLIENRLNPVCEAQKIANVNELAREIKINPYSALGNLVVENMTIQETSFFRGPRVFDNLKKYIIPKLINENVVRMLFHRPGTLFNHDAADAEFPATGKLEHQPSCD
jgi:chemotaxis protein methyltransferase CheR